MVFAPRTKANRGRRFRAPVCPVGSPPWRRVRSHRPRSGLRGSAAQASGVRSGSPRAGLRTPCCKCCPTSNVIAGRRRRSAFLERYGDELDKATRAALAGKVAAVVSAPKLAPFFGPDSRGEVSLTGVLRQPGGASVPYSGRLDRLVVTRDAVSIIDFKLGSPPMQPASAHIQQLALYRAALQPLYPGLPVSANLAYLDGPTLVPIAAADLDAALAFVIAVAS